MIGHDELLQLINKVRLVEGMIDPNVQVQQNGIELTLQHIEAFMGAGAVAFDNSERKLPPTRKIEFDEGGWVDLPKGTYKIVFNEVVNMPKDIAAIAKLRSSLMRCAVTIIGGVWDAGYCGRSEALLVVLNEDGFKVKKNARVLQLLFFRLGEEVREGYAGIYLNENTKLNTKSLASI